MSDTGFTGRSRERTVGEVTDALSRRDVLKSLGCAGAGALLGARSAPRTAVGAAAPPAHASRAGVAEIVLTPVTPHTIRVTLFREAGRTSVPADGSLVDERPLQRAARVAVGSARTVTIGGFDVGIGSEDPLAIDIKSRTGANVQTLRFDSTSGALTFRIGNEALFGLGEGGPQFDRRGNLDRMISGSGGFELNTHGSRVPIPWLVGASGWAMFVHAPAGAFDLRGSDGVFAPRDAAADVPLDLFVVASRDPFQIMREYALLTGFPEMPPMWSLGYQQSHRTLASRDEILGVAKAFRDKKLPCDALIYLGTGFAPVGWNDANGSFDFNPRVFPDPERMIAELHSEHFRVVLHAVILSRDAQGSCARRM